MYTAERIKPKKHPDEKPSESGFNVQYRVLLDDGRQALFDWNPVTPSETMRTWDRYVEWFIDIPNPPDELKFLAYPQNKPEQDGEYWVHDCYLDIWCRAIWDGDILSVWTANVDYFINVRLDKENEMDVNKRLDKLEDVLTELQVFLNGEGILPGVRYFNDDVVKREPEIKACPNPECNVRMERTEKYRCPGCGAEFDRSDDWISVKVRSPEKNVWVLTYPGIYPECSNCLQMPLAYIDVNGRWINGHLSSRMDIPTHWMPLPEPPKES